MTDLPVPCWAGLYSAQLLLALLLAVLRLERAPRHDTLRRVRGTAVLVAVLPVPGPGLLLGATALAALTLLRRRADDDAAGEMSVSGQRGDNDRLGFGPQDRACR